MVLPLVHRDPSVTPDLRNIWNAAFRNQGPKNSSAGIHLVPTHRFSMFGARDVGGGVIVLPTLEGVRNAA
jgi:hypothetical protein